MFGRTIFEARSCIPVSISGRIRSKGSGSLSSAQETLVNLFNSSTFLGYSMFIPILAHDVCSDLADHGVG